MLLIVFSLLFLVASSAASVEPPPQDPAQLDTYMANHGRELFECFVKAKLPDTPPENFSDIVDESMASYYRVFDNDEQRMAALAHAYDACTAE